MFQWHSEKFKIEAWLKVPESDDIDRYAGSPAVKRPEAIRTETDSCLADGQRTAAHIYDRWLERLAA